VFFFFFFFFFLGVELGFIIQQQNNRVNSIDISNNK